MKNLDLNLKKKSFHNSFKSRIKYVYLLKSGKSGKTIDDMAFYATFFNNKQKYLAIFSKF